MAGAFRRVERFVSALIERRLATEEHRVRARELAHHRQALGCWAPGVAR